MPWSSRQKIWTFVSQVQSLILIAEEASDVSIMTTRPKDVEISFETCLNKTWNTWPKGSLA